MLWYEKEITKKIAEQLFAEIEDFTQQYINNRMPRIRNLWPFPKDIYEENYAPHGAVVHLSRTTTIANALFMLSRGVYNTHFLITSTKHSNINHIRYPLMSKLPSYVFMPTHPDTFVQHSGWISTRTIGIDLRNVGQLRPHVAGIDPMPLYTIDNKKECLSYNHDKNNMPDLYTYNDCWREPFIGNSYSYREWWYENINSQQLITLTIILRCLDRYLGLDTSMIVPSNCITGETSISPGIAWDNIRQMINPTCVKYGKSCYNWIRALHSNKTSTKELEDSYDSEALIGSLLDDSRWRGARDLGQLDQLNTVSVTSGASEYKHHLGFLGYEYRKIGGCERSMQLYAAAKNIGYEHQDVIYSTFKNQHVLEID